MEQLVELLKKLATLAEQGVGGEKENANAMLARLMAKHNITADMLAENAVQKYDIRVTKAQLDFAIQIHANVCGTRDSWMVTRGNKKFFRYEATVAEHLEFEAKFPFYWAKYQEELALFFNAFVHRNGLYSSGPATRKWSDLSDEERERYEKVEMMASGLERHQFRKQIGN